MEQDKKLNPLKRLANDISNKFDEGVARIKEIVRDPELHYELAMYMVCICPGIYFIDGHMESLGSVRECNRSESIEYK